MDYSDGSQEFSAELTLRSEVLSPDIPQCTPANMVEVHKDTELSKGEVFKYTENTIIDICISSTVILTFGWVS